MPRLSAKPGSNDKSGELSPDRAANANVGAEAFLRPPRWRSRAVRVDQIVDPNAVASRPGRTNASVPTRKTGSLLRRLSERSYRMSERILALRIHSDRSGRRG